MKSPNRDSPDGDADWFRRVANEPLALFNRYEPPLLWLLPIFLRPRNQYYADAATAVRKRIEEQWRDYGNIYRDRDEFGKSSFVKRAWESGSPPWWGLHDIVGWIDIRLYVQTRDIRISLFLPTKKISRQLKEKTFVCRLQERIALPDHTPNPDIRKLVVAGVDKVASDRMIARFYVDLRTWRRMIEHLDMRKLIFETASEVVADLSLPSTD